MNVEIQFPIEVIVEGTSLQTKRAKTRENWMKRIRLAAGERLPQNHFSTDRPVEVTIFYFSDTKAEGDLDSITPLLNREAWRKQDLAKLLPNCLERSGSCSTPPRS